MTEVEFKEWLSFHAARFPSLSSWLGKIREQPPAGMPSRSDILGAWFDTLCPLTLEQAKGASRLMHGQPDAEQPKAADRHPATILAIVRKIRGAASVPVWKPRRDVDGQETFACLICRDTGAVSVFSGDTIRRIKAGGDFILADDFRIRSVITEAVRCNCSAACRNWPPLAYDPNRMLRVDPLRTELKQLDDVRRWSPVVVGPGRYAEFDAFASGTDRRLKSANHAD
jgi:hypothetical protein